MGGRPRNEAELRALIDRVPMEGAPEALRTQFAELAGVQPKARSIERGGVECLAVGEGPEIVWFHGGGYVFGAPETHVLLAETLAAAGLRVILPRYRLAPEAPWPAMLEDALAVVAASGDVVLGGDSAGGHLALNVALRRSVLGLALVAPNTDRSGRSTTRARTSDAMNDDAGDAELARMAMPGIAPDHTDASPLLADLSGLPPLHLEAASTEILLDDSLMLAAGAARASVETHLHVTRGLFHMFPLWPDALPEGKAALGRLARFAADLHARAGNAG
ncbi:alpha/beta hydrolase [Amaricoccus macauensis]|uniref:alpha/beta hydrolase n=1 Tax=Amaricoccus macauensis TaxID=57001 RepID=UPI003C7E7DB2